MRGRICISFFLFCLFDNFIRLFGNIFRSRRDQLGNVTVAPCYADTGKACIVRGLNVNLGITRVNAFCLVCAERFNDLKHRIGRRL